MQPQEELAALFSRNLTLHPTSHPAPVPAPVPAPAHVSQDERKIVYISQHYNHSAHLAKPNTQPPRPASEPPKNEYRDVEQVLRQQSVDPSGLSAAQLQLFKTSDTPQQFRLIELWRVCPPTSSTDNPTLTWTSTTLEQEEALARQRFEQQQQQQQQQQEREQHLIEEQRQREFSAAAAMETEDHQPSSPDQDPDTETVMSLDGTPLTPITLQAGDGRWLLGGGAAYHYMEPYMLSGYEELARREYEASVRRAYAEDVAAPLVGKDGAGGNGNGDAGVVRFNPAHADPVYKTTHSGGGGGGVLVVDFRREAAMADQYGRFMAMKEDEEML
jgi:hypothetical protein